jgi:hypothetical protein
MKTLIPKTFLSGSTWFLLALAIAGLLQNSQAQTPPAPGAPETMAPSTASVTPPPDIFPTSPLAQVVRLTQAGVDPGVIMTYITNSGSTFNLDSEKIIYASDVGVPGPMVTAMIERDQFLQQQFAAAQAAAAPAAQAPPPADAGPASTTEVAAQPEVQPAPVTVNYFDNTLSPYGSWVVVNGYGRCWRPTVCVYDSSWQPYCDRGHWVYSDCGWYWVSDYAWGATFHYGRWFRNPSYGWCWYPDTVWAPSWVTWRYSNNYCGWAPLPPHTAYQAGVGIVYNGSAVSVGFSFGLGASSFTFVPTQNFCDPHPRNYRVAPVQVAQVYNNTTVINNFNVNNRTIVNHGIPVQNVASITRTTIRPVPVHEINNAIAYHQPVYNQGVIHSAYPGNYNSQLQTERPEPVINNNYHAPIRETPVENPSANYNQPGVTPHGQQSVLAGTPRNVTRNSESRQYYSAPAPAAVPQQHAEPAYTAPQSGGSHGGSQNWPGTGH